jgi:PAS domain S-box-containing protein
LNYHLFCKSFKKYKQADILKIHGRFITVYILPASLLIMVFLIFTLMQIFNIGKQGIDSPYIGFTGIIVLIILVAWIVVQALKDDTKRKEIANQLDDSKEKYKALMETSTDGTLLVLGGEIRYANFVFLAMSGYTMKELLSMHIEDILLKKEHEMGILQIDPGESGRTINSEAIIKGKKGNHRDVILAVSGIRLEESDGLIIIVKDITGRERLEKESMDLMNELQSSLLQMNLPVASIVREFISCDMDKSVLDAAGLMSRKKQDAIIITKGESQPLGIVTDTDLRNRVLATDLDHNIPVSDIMSSPLIRIHEQSLLYEAILKVREHSISHLVVEDKNGNITGIFSNTDLLEVQRNSISYLIREIESAESVESLKKIHNKIPVLIRTLLDSGSRIMNITYMISTVTDAITHRLVEFAIEEMGEPPARFAFMAMGSEGRREQTLVTDQDNAIIFEDVPNERLSEVSRYFLYFGKKINLWLDKIGYRYCSGEVMAGNPQWCQPISRWKKYFSDWVNSRTPEGLLGVAVFFDFRIVFGMEQYGEDLRKHISETAAGKSVFYHLLAREAAAYNVPTELPAIFDVKNALAPLVDFIRVYSVNERVTETNSMLRLEGLQRHNIIEESDFHEIDNVYNRLMEIRFRSHVNAILNNEVPDNLIKQQELTSMEQTLVAKSFAEIKHYQTKILDDFV